MDSLSTPSAGLRSLRLNCQLSQEQAAFCLNISRTTYGAYERGERLIPEEVLDRCSRLYQHTPQVLTDLPESTFSFTEEEQDLLLGYRQLDDSARKQILSMIHFELTMKG